MGKGYIAATSEVGCPWDIASRAHILLRSSEFGLSGFMRRLLTGYAICYNYRHRRWGHLLQNRYKAIVCDEREKVSIEELTSGSRRKEVSAIRGLRSIGLVEKYGFALAEVARRVGVSTSAISKIMQ